MATLLLLLLAGALALEPSRGAGPPVTVGDDEEPALAGASDSTNATSSVDKAIAPGTVVTLRNSGEQVLVSPMVGPVLPLADPADQFVQRRHHQLVLGGKPLYMMGANVYYFVDAASWGGAHGRRQVAEAMAAAKRLGMRVLRTWAFNTRMPMGPVLAYDESQFQALDFIVHTARSFGLRLILALGNFWPAYKSPEDLLWLAVGPAGKTILDFYSLPAARDLYRAHISTMLNRVNTFSGRAYKDDSTIMAWDVLNEPRCPACESLELQDLVVGWMAEMTEHTKRVAPKQLVALGTEGFFPRDDVRGLHLVNPGPGAQCEGEDWLRIISLPSVDLGTLHVYERHMEWQPVPADGRRYADDPDWLFCGTGCYLQWFVRYVQAHVEAVAQVAKPMLLEEFGLSWWKADVRDRKVLLAEAARLLADSAASGGPLAGALVWNGAGNDSSDQDGYNVYLDRAAPRPLRAPPPMLRTLPPVLPALAQWLAAANGNASTALEAAPAEPLLPNLVAAGRRRSLLHSPTREGPLGPAAPRRPVERARGLLWQADQLDGFRRGWERGACAHEASRTWRPPPAFVNATRSDGLMAEGMTPQTQQWMALDLEAWRAYAWPVQEVDLLAWAGNATA